MSTQPRSVEVPGSPAAGRGEAAAGTRLPARAGPAHGRLRQLRHQLLRHLGPVRLHDPVRLRHGRRRTGGDAVGLGGRRPVRAVRRDGAGRGDQRLPDVRSPVLHGRPARRAPLGLVHGLAQPAGPARRDRRHRLRLRPVHRRVPEPPVGLRAHAGEDDADLHGDPAAPRRPEPVRGAAGQRAQLGQPCGGTWGASPSSSACWRSSRTTTSPPSFVFTEFVNDTGWSSPFYVAAIGLLLAQYTFSGYDASAHLSEETSNASVVAPRRASSASIWVSWIAGFVLLAGLTFAIQDYDGHPGQLDRGTAGADPPRRAGHRTARPHCCSWSSWPSCSAATPRWPRPAGWCSPSAGTTRCPDRPCGARSAAAPRPRSRRCGCRWRLACLLALPSLYSATAYGAVTAINVIGITPAYAIPICLRLRAGDRFSPARGAWAVGAGRSAGSPWCWVACVTVLFCLPQSQPGDGATR